MNNEKTVVEVCPCCDRENEMVWDVEQDGYEAYCPHCGTPMMLCDECIHSEDGLYDINSNNCDWYDDGTKRGICFRCKKG